MNATAGTAAPAEQKQREPLNALHQGRLEYLGWDRPWTLRRGEVSVDLRRDFWRAMVRWRGSPCEQDYDRQHYQIAPKRDARYSLRFDQIGGGISLRKRDGFGVSNVAARVEDAMCRLNGRRVIVDISETALLLRADPDDEVFGVDYFPSGNSARVPKGMEQTICKAGAGADGCIFLACGPEGFSCEKFNGPAARELLARKAAGIINATRIGNCAVIGREQPRKG